VGLEKSTVPGALLALFIMVGGDWAKLALQPHLMPRLPSQVVKNLAHPSPPEIRQFHGQQVRKRRYKRGRDVLLTSPVEQPGMLEEYGGSLDKKDLGSHHLTKLCLLLVPWEAIH